MKTGAVNVTVMKEKKFVLPDQPARMGMAQGLLYLKNGFSFI